MRVGIPLPISPPDCSAPPASSPRFWSAKSPEGQWVQTSLLQAQIFMLDFRPLVDGKDVAKQAGNNHPTSIRPASSTSDGYINIATTGGRIWGALCAGDRRARTSHQSRYASAPARSKNRDALNAAIGKLTKKSTETWVSELNAAGVPCGRSTGSTRCSMTPRSTSRHRPGRTQ
jgi:crotonobetainyl-CoA:carnitine CoA-transferase CaiB-like acyl-CoA transferase